jgi:hypothetical protein
VRLEVLELLDAGVALAVELLQRIEGVGGELSLFIGM